MKRVDHILSHWHTLIDNFNTSGQSFYNGVEAAIQARQVPDLSFSRHYFMEGGLASAKREYLRIERKFVAFDICASPYGRGYFFSWWLTRLGPKHPILYLFAFLVILGFATALVANILGNAANLYTWIVIFPMIIYGLGLLVRNRVLSSEEEILMVPVVGWLYTRLFNPITYYSLDTAVMFREAVHAAVLEVIDELTTNNGIRALSDGERKPVMSDLLDTPTR